MAATMTAYVGIVERGEIWEYCQRTLQETKGTYVAEHPGEGQAAVTRKGPYYARSSSHESDGAGESECDDDSRHTSCASERLRGGPKDLNEWEAGGLLGFKRGLWITKAEDDGE